MYIASIRSNMLTMYHKRGWSHNYSGPSSGRPKAKKPSVNISHPLEAIGQRLANMLYIILIARAWNHHIAKTVTRHKTTTDNRLQTRISEL